MQTIEPAPRTGLGTPLIRTAAEADLPALQRIEQRCFDTDRLSRRSFRRLLDSASAILLVIEVDAAVAGYSLFLLKRATPLARLYSIAIDPARRGLGLARLLLEAGEAACRERKLVFVRLEVAVQNGAAIGLYESLGYRPFGEIAHYYEDGSNALRMERRIWRGGDGGRRGRPVPYYAQTTDFTCGPAALMMAMAGLSESASLSRAEELRIWREATTIFMTSGHGGCSPLGLALAAWQRGFQVEVYVNTPGPLFVDGVRNADKKAVLELVHADFMERLAATDVGLHHERLGLDTLRARVAAGAMALVMISSYQFTREQAPHWVLIAGVDDEYFYLHDPDPDHTMPTFTEQMYIPVPAEAFDRMFRFGRIQLRTAVILSPRDGGSTSG